MSQSMQLPAQQAENFAPNATIISSAQLESEPQTPLQTNFTVPTINSGTSTIAEPIREQFTALHLEEQLDLATLNTPIGPKRQTRVSIPWGLDGVAELAIQVVHAMQIWDHEARKALIIMKQRAEGVKLFVESLQRNFHITLSKSPVWATIENGAKKTLRHHQAKRNQEKNQITGDGDRAEDRVLTAQQFQKKQQREHLYDVMLKMMLSFEQFKEVCVCCVLCLLITVWGYNAYVLVVHMYYMQDNKKNRDKQKRKAANMLQAGKHAMDAALGNMAKKIKIVNGTVDLTTTDKDGDKKDAVKLTGYLLILEI